LGNINQKIVANTSPLSSSDKKFRFDPIDPEFSKNYLFILTPLKKANHPTALSDHYLMAPVLVLEGLQEKTYSHSISCILSRGLSPICLWDGITVKNILHR
jgi:hypothetical protein